MKTILADGSYTTNSYDGTRLVSDTSRTGNCTSYGYDLAGRRTSVTNSLGAVTGYAYDDGGNLDHTADALSQTNWYEYDSMNRLARSTLADGRMSTNTYDSLGRLVSRTGAGSVPVFYEYDALSRMTNLIDGVSNQTHFAYDSVGRLTTKTYADGSFYSYSYSSRGWLTNRLDPKGIATSYSYNNVGQLTKVDYATDLDVLYAFDILGRMTGRTDSAGVWSWGYDAQSSRVIAETQSVESVQSVVSYSYAPTTYDLASVSVGPCTTLYSWASGRLVAVTSVVEGASQAFTYAYKANSDLLEDTVYCGPTVTVTRAYDLLDRLTNISASLASSAVNSFSYALDSTGRRTQRQDADGSEISWGYDSFDQLTSASRTNGPNGAFDASYQYQYQYDLVGNRLHEDRGQLDLNGTFNPLNQLTYLDWGGKLDILGSVTNTNGVAVVVSGYTSAPPFYATNWLGGGIVDNPGSNNIPIVLWQGTNSTEKNKVVYMPPTKPQEFVWDRNGNLTNDTQRTLTWDEENRLTAIETVPGLPGIARKRSEYIYDGQGRRSEKKDLSGWTGSSYSTTNVTRFVYDGWNLMAEYGSSVTNYYIWGLDLSQSLQGAGGIGGLLCVIRNGTPYYPVYCGNGNISDYVDQTGAVVAHYEYDPFGRTVAASGAMKDAFSFRFSTKYLDQETGLYYYGYRYYSPSLGRWLSRDPIGEAEGHNLLGYLANNPISALDIWGLCGCDRLLESAALDVFDSGTDKPIVAPKGGRRIAVPGNYYAFTAQIVVDETKPFGDVSCCKVAAWFGRYVDGLPDFPTIQGSEAYLTSDKEPAPMFAWARAVTFYAYEKQRGAIGSHWNDKAHFHSLKEDAGTILLATRQHQGFMMWFAQTIHKDVKGYIQKHPSVYHWNVPFTAVLVDTCAGEVLQTFSGELVGRWDFSKNFLREWSTFYGNAHLEIQDIGIK